MTDTEKIQNLTALLSEIETVFIDRFASPFLSEELSPLLKKWNRMKPHYVKSAIDFDVVRLAVCEATGISSEDFLHSVNRNAADARKMFVGLVFRSGGAKLEAVGNYLNGKDHSTVILSRRRHFELFKNNEKYRSVFLRACELHDNKTSEQ